MAWGEPTKKTESIEKIVISKEERIKQILEKLTAPNKVIIPNRIVALVAGDEGSMKSGIVLNHIKNQLKDTNDKFVYIDLDGGADVLLHHHPEIQNKGKIINPIIFTKNEDGITVIDYIKTFNVIKETISEIKELYNLGNTNIKFLVIDGLSTILKYAERKMRLDKNIAADGGIQTRFWLERNKHFEEILEFSKSIPINSIFVAHDDFNRKADGKDFASIKQKTLALVHQIIETKKETTDDVVTFTATITKSKYNILTENKTFIVSEVKDGKYFIKTNELFNSLLPLENKKKEIKTSAILTEKKEEIKINGSNE